MLTALTKTKRSVGGGRKRPALSFDQRRGRVAALLGGGAGRSRRLLAPARRAGQRGAHARPAARPLRERARADAARPRVAPRRKPRPLRQLVLDRRRRPEHLLASDGVEEVAALLVAKRPPAARALRQVRARARARAASLRPAGPGRDDEPLPRRRRPKRARPLRLRPPRRRRAAPSALPRSG